jgi:Ca-activated chloride channel family protein
MARTSLRVQTATASLLLIALVLTFSTPRAADQQTASPQFEAPRPFRSGVEVVLVIATVTDSEGHYVAGLSKDDFAVYEDGEQQPIAHFSYGRVPISLGIAIDVSGSMRGNRITEARSAIDRFLSDLLEPSDEVFLAAFNHKLKLVAPWTFAPAKMRRSLDGVIPDGGTAMYDAILQAAPTLDSGTYLKKALVVISDGADTASDHSARDVRQFLRRRDALLYAIGIDQPHARVTDQGINPQTLRDMTDETGGRTEVVRDAVELAAATERIALELNQQYILGFAPARPADESFRSIRVRVPAHNYLVRARRGYVAAPLN